MHQTETLKEKLSLFIKILIPILVTQVGIYMMNVFNTLMTGRYGAEDLAGVAIGSSIWVPILTGINGILLALSPIIAQHLGANHKEKIPQAVRQGIYLSIAISAIIAIIGWLFLDPILSLLDVTDNVRHVAKYYLIMLGTGMVFLFLFNLLRCFIDALGQTKISMMMILFALPVNILLNYIFIFGNFGAPKLGGIGAGLATALTYLIISILAIFVIHRMRPFVTYQIFSRWVKPSFKAWKEQLKIGVPIGFTIFFETSIFSIITLLMSTYSTVTIAAHQTAMNFASIFYMIPLAIAMALTIAVGFEVGGRRFKDAKTYSVLGISSGFMTAIISGILIFVFREQVAELYSNDPAVIALAQQFLVFAVFFQLSDGFGAPIQGALRGYKDVNSTLVIAFISFWVIGLPLGIVLSNFTDLNAFGYWVGLIVGLATGAIVLLLRLIHVFRRVGLGRRSS